MRAGFFPWSSACLMASISADIRTGLVIGCLGWGVMAHGASGTSVVAWGNNSYGQTTVPPGLSNAVAIAQGGDHTIALRDDGTVIGWGGSYPGQATAPLGLSKVAAIAAGEKSSLALCGDGTVVMWGDPWQAAPAGLSNVLCIAAGDAHCLALRQGGEVIAWGHDIYGNTNVPVGLDNVTAVVAGGANSAALLANGHVVVWGYNGYPATSVPAGATNLVAVAAGYEHMLALQANGTVLGWGYNNYGQATIPAGLTNVVAIAAGLHHSLALKRDGTVVGWGLNDKGQLRIPPTVTNLVSISARRDQSLALANDGSPWIVRQTTDVSIYSGMDASFTVDAVSPARLSFQWQRNGVKLAAATNSALVLRRAQAADAGDYSVVLSNVFGITTSLTSRLRVTDSAPVTIKEPLGKAIALTSNVTLTVTAAGSVPLTYQWRFKGINLARATNSVLTLTNLQWTNEGLYSVAITNAIGGIVSSNAFVDVVDLAEALNTTNIIWTTYRVGERGWFPQGDVSHDGVAAAQSGADTFAWSCSLSAGVQGPGTLVFWAKTTGNPMVFWSSSAAPADLFILGDWQQQTVYVGTGSPVIEWLMGPGSSYPGFIDQVAFTPGTTAPFLSSFSTNQTVVTGTNVTLSAGVLGTPPFTYRWQFNGTEMVGATNYSLSLTNVQVSDSGVYGVVASSANGSAATNAILTVLPPVTSATPSILVNDGHFGFHSELFGFNVCSAPGQMIVIEASADLETWGAVCTNVVDSSGSCFFSEQAPAGRYRFFRARVVAP